MKGTKGAVSYNEWSFAKSQKLSVAKIVTSAGPDAVELTTASAGKSIDGVKIKGTGFIDKLLPPVVIGYLLLISLGTRAPLGAWLDDLYVAPRAQGAGVGAALLDLVKSLPEPALLVVGNKGMNSLTGRLLGSVPSDAARKTSVDILIVHTT